MEATPFRKPYAVHIDYRISGDTFTVKLSDVNGSGYTELWFTRVRK